MVMWSLRWSWGCWARETEGNLGTEDGAGLECTKIIKLIILKVDSHISHYVGWEAQSTTFPIMFHVTIKQHYYEVT